MAQNPLPPPPPSGGVLDGWLYLLWRRLTQTGQILWDSITPGTSADVADVVTDETGSPGSLVFSGNPTLDGITNAGNLVFSGSGRRITGDFSSFGANTANRTIFQSSVTDGNTFLICMPNGTSQIAGIGGYDSSSDLANCSTVQMYTTGGGSLFVSGRTGTGTYRLMAFYTSGSEQARIAIDGTFTAGGVDTAPALKVTPVASQARWIEVTGATSSTNPTIGVSGGNLATSAVFMPVQATTAGAPAYVLGGMYFDTTLNKLRIGGAAAWETVTSV